MSDQPQDPAPAPATPPSAPLWAKIAGALAAVVLVVVIVMLVVGGEHSPGRHFGGESDAPQHTPPPGVTHEQP